MKKKSFPWQGRVSNIQQLGGIETSVIDNGPGKGCRIAWVNTGGGLRYKVVIDRALDIADAFFNQHSLAWLSRVGVTAPRPDANKSMEWLYSFGGGLLTTCGLTHIGGPEKDEYEERGLHGRVSNIPATLESVIQPEPASGKMDMSITALIKESKVFGPDLDLRRTITSTLGESKIKIRDEVTNCGNSSIPHMILYHCNFGWPLVDEGTDIIYKGRCESRAMEMDNDMFNDKHNYKKCQKPLDIHRGSGESCGFIDVTPGENGNCTVGLANRNFNIALVMKYKKQQLPCLTNWQHWGPGEYVCALEPGTNPPIGQNKAKEMGKLIYLEPSESKIYDLKMEVLTKTEQIDEFIKTAG